MAEKLRVAVIYHYFALYRLPILKELMKDDQIEYTFISGITSDTPIKLIDNNLSIRPDFEGGLRWLFVKNIWLWKKRLLWQKGLRRTLSEGKFNACIFLGSPYYLSTWVSLIHCRLRKVKAYLWMHGINHSSLRFSDLPKLLFYNLADGYFLYGNRATEFLKQWLKKEKTFNVIYNSLNYAASFRLRSSHEISQIPSFRNQWFPDANLPIVVFIGRVNKVKRIDLLIRAQAQILANSGKLRFNIIVIGDGEEKRTLAELADDLGLKDDIRFTGALYDEEVTGRIIQNCDLCVTPGEIGLTAIHALSLGTPVISHNNLDIQMPEVEAIEPGKTGSLFSYHNPEELATDIMKWLDKFPIKTVELMKDCYQVIDSYYNPAYQAKVFHSVLLKGK